MVTREEILAMEPGRELDKLVAEKVFGWEVVPKPTRLLRDLRAGDVCHPDKVPSFSTKLAAAWLVVEELEKRFGDGGVWKFDNERAPKQWQVCFARERIPTSNCYKGLWQYLAGTITEGICKTAVLVILDSGGDASGY